MTFNITVNPNKLLSYVYWTILVLSVLHIGNLFLYFLVNDPEEFYFIQLIDFDYEQNIPTLFSSLLFIINAQLIFAITQKTRRFRRYWLGLAFLFVFLAFDESCKIHEHIGDAMEHVVNAEGYLYFPWFIPYVSLFTVACLIYLPFYFRLSRPIQIRFGVAACLYLIGAVGFDIVSAKEADDNGTETIFYSVLYTIEELLEMLALAYFMRTLMNILLHQRMYNSS